jgi:excisionase family DNA binding protein
MTTTGQPRYLYPAEAAAILHVSPKTVTRWAKEGKLPFLKTLGGHRRYPEREIRQLADRLTTVVVPASAELRAYIPTLVDRADRIRGGGDT